MVDSEELISSTIYDATAEMSHNGFNWILTIYRMHEQALKMVSFNYQTCLILKEVKHPRPYSKFPVTLFT